MCLYGSVFRCVGRDMRVARVCAHCWCCCCVQIRSVLERIQETVASHDACVKNALDKYTLLHSAVTQYNKRLKDALH
jgi:hypothetical protein